MTVATSNIVGYRLIKSTVEDLTPELAERFRSLDASPTERELNKSRIEHLRQKAESGQLITFSWSTAKMGNKILRMNGQHSANMLCALNGHFPTGLKVHLDEYEVESKDWLAVLFRQFDDRKSGRSPNDVSGAYQGLYEELAVVPRGAAKVAAEAVAWYRAEVEGLPANSGDDRYMVFNETGLHSFIQWLGQTLNSKTPELRRHTIVSAMFGTFRKNEAEARKFWADVARGGREFEDNAPATILDGWLKNAFENRTNRRDLKPGHFYQGCIYAWNAYRDGKTITAIKHDTKKGLLVVSDE